MLHDINVNGDKTSKTFAMNISTIKTTSEALAAYQSLVIKS